jgi:hypothetical protein
MDKEKYHQRDLTYSLWHRTESIERYLGHANAEQLRLIDIDAILYVEYERYKNRPLALIEEARDVGQSFKCAAVMANLARMAKLPAFLVLWLPSSEANPVTNGKYPDIERFRVRPMNVKKSEPFGKYSARDYAVFLWELRQYRRPTFDTKSFLCWRCEQWHFVRHDLDLCGLCAKTWKQPECSRRE